MYRYKKCSVEHTIYIHAVQKDISINISKVTSTVSPTTVQGLKISRK